MQTVVTPKIRWVFIFQGPEARKRGFLREAGHGEADGLWVLEQVRFRTETDDQLWQFGLLRTRNPSRWGQQ